jgi:hypothetical protein
MGIAPIAAAPDEAWGMLVLAQQAHKIDRLLLFPGMTWPIPSIRLVLPLHYPQKPAI